MNDIENIKRDLEKDYNDNLEKIKKLNYKIIKNNTLSWKGSRVLLI